MTHQSSLQFLGTGSGFVSRERNHSALLITDASSSLLIDCGDGIAKSMLQAGVDFSFINAIVITHLHSDHYTGLPSLLTQMKAAGRLLPLHIFAPTGSLTFLDEFLQRSYIFPEYLGFRFSFEGICDGKMVKPAGNIHFTPIANTHLDKYRLRTARTDILFESFSALIETPAWTGYYSGDIGGAADLRAIPTKKLKYIICESSHIRAEEAIKALAGIEYETLVFTHISDATENALLKHVGDLKKTYQKDIIIGHDRLILY